MLLSIFNEMFFVFFISFHTFSLYLRVGQINNESQLNMLKHICKHQISFICFVFVYVNP